MGLNTLIGKDTRMPRPGAAALLRRAAVPCALGLAAAACNPLLGIDDYQFGGAGGQSGGAGGQSGGAGGQSGGTGGQSGGAGGGGAPCDPGSTQPCYSGPDSTSGVGACKDGTQTCEQGGKWGPCAGEVLPVKELCDGANDEDCDGFVDEDCGCVPGTNEPCYSGPPATVGVAGCTAGEHTCLPDGTGYGPCKGEVTPQVEICPTLVDESCDGFAGCVGSHVWSKRFGGAGDQFGNDVAGDKAGNVVAVGKFSGTVDFGGGAFSGSDTVYLAKLGPSGAHAWSKTLGNSCMYCSSTVKIDPQNRVFLAGGYNGTLGFGGGVSITNNGEPNIYVASLDPGGAGLWARQFGGTGSQHATSLALGPKGDIVIAGSFAGDLDFGAGPLAGKAFVARLDEAGNPLWSKGLSVTGGSGALSIAGIGVDAAGDIVLAGVFNGVADVGAGEIASDGTDVFVAKMSSTGAPIWTKRFGGAGADLLNDAAVDPGGSVVLTGFYSEPFSFGAADLPAVAGQVDIFVARLDAAGNHVWSKGIGGPSIETGDKIAVDDAGNVLVSGYCYQSTFTFGGPTLVASNPGGDTYLAKLDPQGNHLWSKILSAADPASSQSNTVVRTDASGSVLLTGIVSGIADFGGGALPPGGGWDIFVARLSP